MAKLSELAAHLGLSVTRVSQLKSAGVLPDAPRGRHDLDACRTAYLTHLREVAAGRMAKDGGGFDLVTERARLAAAQAEKVERQNAVEKGDLIPAAEFHQMMTSAFVRVRAKLLALPSRLTPVLAIETKAAVVEAVLKAEIYAALNELAATRITADGQAVDGPDAASEMERDQ